MFTKIPAVKLARKVLAATVVGGALALGTGGAAFAATSTTVSGSTPAAGHVTCARAPKALAKITKVEKFAAKRLPALQARANKLTAAGHRKLASRVEKKIKKLQKADTKAGALATKIEARCPSGTSS
jgi:hypothetical protein